MIHIDRLHRAICRLTGSPFAFVLASVVVEGTSLAYSEWVHIEVRGRCFKRRTMFLRSIIHEIKRDHGWDSTLQSSSRQ